MGTGKTNFLLNIIFQWKETNRKMVIHDTKAEFTDILYRDNKDYILNISDKRGCYWDIFKDIENGLDIDLVSDFFYSYFTAIAGDKGDKFWLEKASERFNTILKKLIINKDIDNSLKLEILLKEMLLYIEEIKYSNDKTEQSIASTLETTIGIFIRLSYMSKEKHKKITITDFFKSKDSRLFIHNIEANKRSNMPYITSFLSLLFKYQMTNFNNVKEEDYVLYVLDEYLDFFNYMRQDIRDSLHTKARSYGVLLLPAMQYLPEDKELEKNLTSSIENLFIFKLSKPSTIKFVIDKIGKIKTKSNDKEATKEAYLLDENIIKKLEIGHHITYIPSKVLYLGYTKNIKIDTPQKNLCNQ